MNTKQRCEVCGIWCHWSAFDLQWNHQGWTVNGNEQPKPHTPVVSETPVVVGGLALDEGPDE